MEAHRHIDTRLAGLGVVPHTHTRGSITCTSLQGRAVHRTTEPGCSSSLASRRSNNVNASAVAPAKPAMTPSDPSRRTWQTEGQVFETNTSMSKRGSCGPHKKSNARSVSVRQ